MNIPVEGGSLVGSRMGAGEPALLIHGGPGLAEIRFPRA